MTPVEMFGAVIGRARAGVDYHPQDGAMCPGCGRALAFWPMNMKRKMYEISCCGKRGHLKTARCFGKRLWVKAAPDGISSAL